MRYTPSGVPVATFSLAVNRRWTGTDGQHQEKTTWFRVTAWRKDAELVSQYLSKGRQVLIVGEIEEARPFMGQDGQPRASLEVTARNIRFIGGRGEGGGNFAHEETGAAAAAPRGNNRNAPAPADMDMTDEDIPF
jgi:single-strand DNA-binding protein